MLSCRIFMLGLSECVFLKKNSELKSYPKTVCCSFNFMCMPIFFWQKEVFSHYIETVKRKKCFQQKLFKILTKINSTGRHSNN